MGIGKQFSWLVILSSLGYVVSFANQLLISYYFGNSARLDAYWAAFTLVNMLTFYMHPIREALVPEFHRRLTSNKDSANEYLSQVITVLIVITVVVTIPTTIFPQWLVSFVVSSRQPEMQREASHYIRLFAPSLLLLVISETLNAILTCYNRVVFQAVSRVLGALTTISIIVVFAGWIGVTALPIGFICAQLLTAILQMVALYRQGIRFRFGWLRDGGKRFFLLSGTLIVSYALSQVYAGVEKQTFSAFGTGIVSSFQYATSLTNVAIALVGSTLASALWPRFLDQVAANQQEKMLENIFMALRVLMIALGWIAVVCYINAQQIIQLVFERGAFGSDAVIITSTALRATIFAALPIAGITLIGRALVSLGSIRALAFVSISITSMGLITLYVARIMGTSHLAMMHWLVANSVGCVVSIWMVSRRCSGTYKEIMKFTFWCVRLFIALGFAAWLSPLSMETNGKIHLFWSLFYNGLFFTLLLLAFLYLLRIHTAFMIASAYRKKRTALSV